MECNDILDENYLEGEEEKGPPPFWGISKKFLPF